MIFFHKESKSKTKKQFFFFLGGGGGEGAGWGEAQTCPNQFAPSTSSKLGAKKCITVQVM